MIETGKTYMVMGLLDSESIAYAVGQRIEEMGGKVIFTAQNEILTARYLNGDKAIGEQRRRRLDVRYCDVIDDAQIAALFAGAGELGGVVHSLAYANPRTLLGEEFHTDAMDDVLRSYQVSCASLAAVARHARVNLAGGGSIVALTFDTRHVYPFYNWMGVHKAALEALVRALARRHGRDRVRVNAVSAGPLLTKASSHIPGFGSLTEAWNQTSPIPWDAQRDRDCVADAVLFLLGPHARKITGQILAVDGGASIMGGQLMPFERPPESA